jgi:hypothetical protein
MRRDKREKRENRREKRKKKGRKGHALQKSFSISRTTFSLFSFLLFTFSFFLPPVDCPALYAYNHLYVSDWIKFYPHIWTIMDVAHLGGIVSWIPSLYAWEVPVSAREIRRLPSIL